MKLTFFCNFEGRNNDKYNNIDNNNNIIIKKENEMEEMRNAYIILLGKPEMKEPLGIPRCICEDNIKMVF